MIKSLPNLYSFLYLNEEDVLTIVDNIDKYYYHKIQPKKKYGRSQIGEDGKIRMRHLLIPEYILKSRQKRITNLLNEIPLPTYMYGSVTGKNNIMNATCHRGSKFFLKIDLKSFFPNINNRQVFDMFIENKFSPSVSHILTKLTTFKHSLPQGAPSSPVIANLVFKKTGDKLASIAKQHNLIFTTYLDDLAFSAKHPFEELSSVIQQVLKEDNFYPAQEKVNYYKSYCEITGIFVHPHSLELPFEMQNEARRNKKLREYQKFVEHYNIASI